MIQAGLGFRSERCYTIIINGSFLKQWTVGNLGDYLEGQGDLVTRLRMGIIGVIIWVIGVINLLTKSP